METRDTWPDTAVPPSRLSFTDTACRAVGDATRGGAFAVMKAERRNLASRERLVRRLRAEFSEMPGLRLTATQAARLLSVRLDICVRLLATLVERGVIRCTADGAHVRTRARGVGGGDGRPTRESR